MNTLIIGNYSTNTTNSECCQPLTMNVSPFPTNAYEATVVYAFPLSSVSTGGSCIGSYNTQTVTSNLNYFVLSDGTTLWQDDSGNFNFTFNGVNAAGSYLNTANTASNCTFTLTAYGPTPNSGRIMSMSFIVIILSVFMMF